jgi:hypothetical protein
VFVVAIGWIVAVIVFAGMTVGIAAIGTGVGSSLDETLMQAEFAVIADRDDNAGAGALLVVVDGEAVDRLIDFGAAIAELGGFGREFVGPFVSLDVLEFAQALLDAFDLGGEIGRDFGGLRAQAGILRKLAIFELERRPDPFPLRAQFGGFGFELLERKAAYQRHIVHKAVIVAAEQIAGDGTACGFVRFGADEHAKFGIERNRAFGQQTPDCVRRDIGMILELVPDGALRRMIGAEGEGGHGVEIDGAGAVGVE